MTADRTSDVILKWLYLGHITVKLNPQIIAKTAAGITAHSILGNLKGVHSVHE